MFGRADDGQIHKESVGRPDSVVAGRPVKFARHHSLPTIGFETQQRLRQETVVTGKHSHSRPTHTFEMDDTDSVNPPLTSTGHLRRRSQSQSGNGLLSSSFESGSGMMRDDRVGTAAAGNQNTQKSLKTRFSLLGTARHTLGLFLLGCVIFLWTLSNFLGSSIFADNTYAKPFFLTYLNTSFFVFATLPSLIKGVITRHRAGTLEAETSSIFSWRTVRFFLHRSNKHRMSVNGNELGREGHEEAEAFLVSNDVANPDGFDFSGGEHSTSQYQQPEIEQQGRLDSNTGPSLGSEYLPLLPTARLALAFALLWFGANYFAMACLQHTTVASTTILSSTSSVWTLLFGAFTRTEKFTWRKLCGVLGSLAGIILISHADFSSPAPGVAEHRHRRSDVAVRSIDDFPDKPASELALGDAMALLSALIYGVYTITLKRSTLSAAPLSLHMPTFFGLVGFFNMFLALPLFPVLHFTQIEPFQLPPSKQIWAVLLVNSVSSFMSDILWAYAMVFTGPLVVTVGLSLTIPLSLIGEMVVQGKYESWVYWFGACIVIGSFVFVEREEKSEVMDGKGVDLEKLDDDIDGRRNGMNVSDDTDMNDEVDLENGLMSNSRATTGEGIEPPSPSQQHPSRNGPWSQDLSLQRKTSQNIEDLVGVFDQDYHQHPHHQRNNKVDEEQEEQEEDKIRDRFQRQIDGYL